MTTTIQKWGNSQGVRLPKVLLESIALKEKDSVEINIVEDSIIIKKAPRKRRSKISLKERLKDWNGKPYELTDEDISWLNMKPMGDEVW